jgi:hypothetical protein
MQKTMISRSASLQIAASPDVNLDNLGKMGWGGGK